MECVRRDACILWVFEEVDDLAQFLLGLVDTGDIVERHIHIRFGDQLRLAAASGEQPAAQAAPHHPAGSKPPDPHKDQRRHDP